MVGKKNLIFFNKIKIKNLHKNKMYPTRYFRLANCLCFFSKLQTKMTILLYQIVELSMYKIKNPLTTL